MLRSLMAVALTGMIGFTGLSLSVPSQAQAQIGVGVEFGPIGVQYREGRHYRGPGWRGGPRYGNRWGHHRPHRAHRPYRPPYAHRPYRPHWPGPVVRYHRPYYHVPAAPRVYPRYAAPMRLTAAHVEWCYARYRSYRATDNSFQPYHGPRRRCLSPYG